MKLTSITDLSVINITKVGGGNCFCYKKEFKPASASSIINDGFCEKWCCHADGYIEGVVMWGIGITATDAKKHAAICKPTKPAQYFQSKSLQHQIISEVIGKNYPLDYATSSEFM